MLEARVIMAQALANLHIWGHADPLSPPFIDGPEVRIRLIDPACQPVNIKPRRMDPYESAAAHWRCQLMLRQGRIEPSSSEWNHPLLMVPYPERIVAFNAKHGARAVPELMNPANAEEVKNLFRMTSDLRGLNKETLSDGFPLPVIAALLDDMAGSDRKTISDVEDAFFTMALAAECRHYTAFTTPTGRFQYCCAPQGAKNSASDWARAIDRVLSPMRGQSASWFQDDTNNYAFRDLIDHVDTQQMLFDCLLPARMTLKPSKHHANYPALKILGFICMPNGRRPDPGLVEAVLQLRAPSSLTAVRSFLGLAQVAREFIPALATIVEPIQRLVGLKKPNIPALWDGHCEVAFSTVKRLLTSAPVLRMPDPSKRYRIHCDACKVGRGLGAVLLQEDEHGTWHPVAYWSRNLTTVERKRSATMLECMAMHLSIMHWHVYLRCGQPFDVITDHYALVYLVTKLSGDPYHTLARMCTALQRYNFSVTHRSGVDHLDADAISRLFRTTDPEILDDEGEFRETIVPLTLEDLSRLDTEFPVDAPVLKAIIQAGPYVDPSADPPTAAVFSDTNLQVNSAMVPVVWSASHSLATWVSLVPSTPFFFGGDIVTMETQGPLPNSLRHWRYQRQEIMTLRVRRENGGFSNYSTRRLPGGLPGQGGWEKLKFESHVHTDRVDNEIPTSFHLPPEGFVPSWAKLAELIQANGASGPAQPEFKESGQLAPLNVMSGKVDGQVATRRAVKLASLNEEEKELEERERRAKFMQTIRSTRGTAAKPGAKERAKQPGGLTPQEESPPEVTPTIPQAQIERAAVEEVVAEERANMTEERRREQLERYDYLHRRLYEDPATGCIYEVHTIVERRVKRQRVLIAYSTLVDLHQDSGQHPQVEQIQRREVLGPSGVEELVLDFEPTLSPGGDNPLAKTLEQWAEVQAQDPALGPLLSRLQGPGDALTCGKDQYLVRSPTEDPEKGPLVRVVFQETRTTHSGMEVLARRRVMQIVVPAACQRELVRAMHHQLGHPGVRRTMDTMKLRYWFPTIKREVRRCVAVCTHCNERKADNRRAKVPIQAYGTIPLPMWRVHMDLTGPFPVTQKGAKYILVLKCAFTKFARMYALVDKCAEQVLTAVDDFTANYGPMAMLITDRGSEFCNALVQDLVLQLGTRKISTTAANPRSDGLAENQMRVLKDTLSGYCNKFQDDWDLHLGHISRAYNSTVHSATGYSPHFLLFGREMMMPGEEASEVAAKHHKTYSSWAKRMREVLLYTWEHVHGKVSAGEADLNVRPIAPLEYSPYSLGDWVYLRRVPMRGYKGPSDLERRKTSAKLQMRWTGPYRVIKAHSDVVFTCLVHGRARVTHAINMKRASATRDDYLGQVLKARVRLERLQGEEIRTYVEQPLHVLGAVTPTLRVASDVTKIKRPFDRAILDAVHQDEGAYEYVEPSSDSRRQEYWSSRWLAAEDAQGEAIGTGAEVVPAALEDDLPPPLEDVGLHYGAPLTTLEDLLDPESDLWQLD